MVHRDPRDKSNRMDADTPYEAASKSVHMNGEAGQVMDVGRLPFHTNKCMPKGRPPAQGYSRGNATREEQ